MSDQQEEIRKLLRLRGNEQPPEGFFDDFLKEFQHRQRAELLNRSAHGLFFERLGTYFSGFGSAKWVGAAAGACAIALLSFFVMRGADGNLGNTAPGTELAAGGSQEFPHLGTAQSRVEFVAPVSLLIVDDIYPPKMPTYDHALVRAEGPFSDYFNLSRPSFSPGGNPLHSDF